MQPKPDFSLNFKITTMKPEIINIEYWLDGITSSYQVSKKEFYNNNCFSGFMLLFFNDGTVKSVNKKTC